MEESKSTLNLLTFASKFHPQTEAAIRNSHLAMFERLDKCYNVRVVMSNELDDFLKDPDRVGQTFVFMATGGTENMVRQAYELLPHPLALITDGKANSLAASMELACWARQQGDECFICDEFTIRNSQFTMDYSQCAICNLQCANNDATLLKGERIGVIGKPSDWLISSDVDYDAARERWGVEYVDIPLSKVELYYNMCDDDVSSMTAKLLSEASGCEEPNEKDIAKAFRLYLALKKVVEEYRLTALTIQCFSLIPTTCTTGCLALALLNDEGIVAGCEGDLQSIFTMLLAKRATGVDGFMANPSSADKAANRIVFAHCTIGLKQTCRYVMRSHFESGIGVAIQGILPEGEVTIVKCGGKSLDKSVILTGRIIDNQSDPNNCRTQILVDLDDSIDYFFNNNIGNHHIILQGSHKRELEAFFEV
ncbi:MAG: fucose isomerase [Prevotellaceae bacterium]|nr:fucose isomerase [Prevotellaceae bacterium]